jgi:hypothetical protein
MKTKTSPLLITLTLICLALSPNLYAVLPAPDGGYPGFNTAEGTNALKNLTTGVGDTAVGWYSLFSNTDGSFNTGVGAATLVLNVGDQSTGDGVDNTAVGAAALFLNISGSDNTAVGTATLVNNSTGDSNSALGAFALNSNTTGSDNTATGFNALVSNIGGVQNTANGTQALALNTTGSHNTATGFHALFSNTNADNNTAYGYEALLSNTGPLAMENTAVGFRALRTSNSGVGNTAIGYQALQDNTTGLVNTAVGDQALSHNNGGSFNTAYGAQALFSNTTGSSNIALGTVAGNALTIGDDNIDIGNSGAAGESRTIRIGNSLDHDRTFIAGIRGKTTGSMNTLAVLIDVNGQLGTASSSRRFKKEIKPMEKASEAILALKPVTFHYKSDTTSTPQFGLIAEEVAEVNPDLVVRDENGEIYSVRYDAVNAMLLNEFLKEHRRVQKQTQKIQEQETTIAELKKQVQTVVAHAKEQDIKIQRVSDQIQINSSPVVVTDR